MRRTLACYVNKTKPGTRETVQSVLGCASSRTSSLAFKGAPGRVLCPCNLSAEECGGWGIHKRIPGARWAARPAESGSMEVGGERVEWWGSLCGVGGKRVGWWGSLELAGQPDQLNQEAWGLVRDSAFKNEVESD